MWHSPVITAAPAVEPISVDAAKQFLRLDLDDTAFDLEVETYAAGARAHVEKITGTRMITQTVTIVATAFADLARLPIGPVQEVTSISYIDVAGDLQAVAPDGYELFGADLDRGIRPTFGDAWPIAASYATEVTVVLVVGYGDDIAAVPAELKIAMLSTARGLFDDRTADVDRWLVNHRIWL